jgi:hypothetical protein
MLLQYDGLDTIGDEEDDYKDTEGMEISSDSASDVEDDLQDDDDEEVEIQVGYAEKRSRLWVHHKYALANGDIRWMKTAKECRPTSRADPNGADGPWDL